LYFGIPKCYPPLLLLKAKDIGNFGKYSLSLFKNIKTSEERYIVYRLCKGFRLNGGVYQHIIISFGKFNEPETVEQKKLLAIRKNTPCVLLGIL